MTSLGRGYVSPIMVMCGVRLVPSWVPVQEGFDTVSETGHLCLDHVPEHGAASTVLAAACSGTRGRGPNIGDC